MIPGMCKASLLPEPFNIHPVPAPASLEENAQFVAGLLLSSTKSDVHPAV